MATISAPDLVLLRTTQHKLTPRLSVMQPVALLTARVNNGAIARGARSIAYDGGGGSGFATIEANQTLWVGTSAGAYNVGTVRVKAIAGNQAAGTITVAENGIDWVDDLYLTVLHNYEIWPIPLRVSGGVFYIDYDVTFSGQTSQPPPVAIAGSHRAARLTQTSITATIDATADDGYVEDGPGNFFPNANYVRFGVFLAGIINYDSWFRFDTVNIPAGATIDSANLTLRANLSTGSYSLVISAEDVADANAPISYVDYAGKATTTATTNWVGSGAWANNQTIITPDITAVIQEVIDLAGWTSGNAIQVFIKSVANSYREVKSLDGGYTTLLNVTYNSASFALDASDSYAVADGAAIASYAWTCIKNGGDTDYIAFSDTGDNTSAIANPTLTIGAAGQYWLKLTVTDDNGKSQSTYRAIFVHDSSYPEYRDFNITNMSGSWDSGGWSVGINAFGDVELGDFPDSALALLWSVNYFGDSEDYVNLWGVSNEVICAGYIRQESDSDDLGSGDGDISFTIVTPEAVLAQKAEMSAISIEAVTTPTKWYEYASWLTAGRAVHYLLRWYSTVMQTCDVYGLLDNTLGVEAQSFIQESILAMVNSFTYDAGIFAKLISDRLGRLHLVEDSQMFDDATRAAQDTVFEFETTDLSATVNLGRQPVKPTALGFLAGVTFDGSAKAAFTFIIPGYPAGAINIQFPEFDGSGAIQKTNQIIEDQADGEMKTGRILAAANNPLKEQRLDLRGNYLGAFDIVPSIGWYDWGIADATFKRNLDLNGTRWLCRQVSASFPATDVYSGSIDVSAILEGEAFGPDGLLADYPTDYPTPKLPSPNWTPVEADPIFDTYTAADDEEFDANAINEVVVTRLSDTTAFILYTRDLGGGTQPLYGTVISWDGMAISVDVAATEINGSDCQAICVDRIDATHVLCTYRIAGSFEFYGNIVEIGGTLSIGATKLISSGVGGGGIGWNSVISTVSAMTVYNDDGGAYAQIVDLNTLTLVIDTNTPELIDANATYPVCVNIATGVAITGYIYNGTDGRCRTITYVGTTISAVNGDTTFEGGTPADAKLDIDRIDNTHAIISYIDTGNSDYPTICILTLASATSITAATPVVVNSDAAANVARCSVFNTSTAVMIYDDSSQDVWLQLLDVLNTPASASGSRVSIYTAGADFADVGLLSASYAVIVYGWVDSSNDGLVEVGGLS